MADRTSARLFGEFFEFLAETPDERSKAMALLLWSMTGQYDFSPHQMDADEALRALDLCGEGTNRWCKPGETTTVYGPPGDRE